MKKIAPFIFMILLVACDKQDQENHWKNSSIIRINDAQAYAITPDGRIWILRSDKAYLVQKDTLHTFEEILKREQEERERLYEQKQRLNLP